MRKIMGCWVLACCLVLLLGCKDDNQEKDGGNKSGDKFTIDGDKDDLGDKGGPFGGDDKKTTTPLCSFSSTRTCDEIESCLTNLKSFYGDASVMQLKLTCPATETINGNSSDYFILEATGDTTGIAAWSSSKWNIAINSPNAPEMDAGNTCAAKNYRMFIRINPQYSPKALPNNLNPLASPNRVGLSTTGMLLYNAMDSLSCNAIYAEYLSIDAIAGHCDADQSYHHHSEPFGFFNPSKVNLSPAAKYDHCSTGPKECRDILKANKCGAEFDTPVDDDDAIAPVANYTTAQLETDGHGFVLGFALDGYPIYSSQTESSETALDDCGGHGNGKERGYHYHTQAAHPYTMGCFKGTVSKEFDRPDGYICTGINCLPGSVDPDYVSSGGG